MSDLSERLAALKNKLSAASQKQAAPPTTPPASQTPPASSGTPAAPATPPATPTTPAAKTATAPATPAAPASAAPKPPATTTSRFASTRQAAPEVPAISHPAIQEALTYLKSRAASNSEYAECERMMQKMQAEYAASKLRLMLVGASSEMCQRVGDRLLQDPDVARLYDVSEQPIEVVLRLNLGRGEEEMILTDKTSLTIGRKECDIKIDNQHISRQHASFRAAPGHKNRFIVRDEASTNGTYINGARMRGEQMVGPGDSISFAVDLLGNAAPYMTIHERSGVDELKARLEELVAQNEVIGLVVDVTRPLLPIEERVLKTSQQQRGCGFLVLTVIPADFNGNDAFVRGNIDEIRHRGGLLLRLDNYRHLVQVDEREDAKPAPTPPPADDASKISNLHKRLTQIVAERRDWAGNASEWLSAFAQAENPRLGEARLKAGWAQFIRTFEDTHQRVREKATDDLRMLRDKSARDEAGRKLWQTAPALADQTQAAALKDIKKDLDQSKGRFLEPMLPDSLSAKVIKMLETFEIHLQQQPRQTLHLIVPGQPSANPDDMVFQMILSEVKRWGDQERTNIREKYGHGGIYQMLDDLRQMLYQLPSVSGTDRFTRGFYDETPMMNLLKQAYDIRVQGAEWNVPFKKDPPVAFVLGKTRMSLMTISSVVMIFSIFLPQAQTFRKKLFGDHWVVMIFVAVVVISCTTWYQIKFYKQIQEERQETEADKLREKIQRHYLEVADIMATEVHKALQNSLDWLERSLKSENVRLGDDITGVTKDNQAQGKLLDQQILAAEQVVDACDQEGKWLATARNLVPGVA